MIIVVLMIHDWRGEMANDIMAKPCRKKAKITMGENLASWDPSYKKYSKKEGRVIIGGDMFWMLRCLVAAAAATPSPPPPDGGKTTCPGGGKQGYLWGCRSSGKLVIYGGNVGHPGG